MITLFWTVLFCLGWRMVTDEGQLLHFIKRPFLDSLDFIENYEDKMLLAKTYDKPSVDVLKRSLLKHKLIYYIGKPFVLCITCYASLWGITVFVTLNGLNSDLIAPLILNCVSASFIQTFIWNFYGRYIQ